MGIRSLSAIRDGDIGFAAKRFCDGGWNKILSGNTVAASPAHKEHVILVVRKFHPAEEGCRRTRGMSNLDTGRESVRLPVHSVERGLAFGAFRFIYVRDLQHGLPRQPRSCNGSSLSCFVMKLRTIMKAFDDYAFESLFIGLRVVVLNLVPCFGNLVKSFPVRTIPSVPKRSRIC